MKKLIIIIKLIIGLCILALSLNSVFSISVSEVQGYWTFDNTLIDSKGGIGTATNNGASYTASGLINGSYSYDGSSSYITIPDYSESSDTSISFWIKFDTIESEYIIRKGGSGAGWFIYTYSDGAMQFGFKDGTNNLYINTASSYISTGVWYHFVIVKDGTTLYAYKNAGTPDSTTNGAFTSYANSDTINLGYSGSFDGIIDEFSIFNVSLSSLEISELYNSGNGYNPFLDVPVISTNITDYYNSENISIQLNTISNVNMSYVLDAGTETSICTNCNNSVLELTEQSEGLHNITFISNYDEGEVNTTASFTIDTITPIININEYTEHNYYNITDINETLNITCNDINIDTCIIEWEDTTTTNIRTTSLKTFATNGNHTFTFTATDLAGNTDSLNGTVFINPIGQLNFQLSNGTEINNFEIDGVDYNESYTFKYYDFGIGSNSVEFSKLGFITEDIQFNLTQTNLINQTYNVTESSITINIYDRTTGAYITSNTSIQLISTYGFDGSTVTGQLNITNINFINELYQVIITNDAYYTETLYFNFNNQENIQIDAYMISNASLFYGQAKVVVTAETGQLIQGAICTASEWKSLDSAYVGVSQGLTDSNGETLLNIEIGTKIYEFSCTKSGVTKTLDGQIVLVDNSIIPITLSQDLGITVDSYANIEYNLTNESYNATHQRIIYNFRDTDNIVAKGCLNIYQMNGLKKTLLQSSCIDGNIGEIQLIQDINTSYNIEAQATVEIIGQTIVLKVINFYSENDIRNLIVDYGLDIILPLIFAIVGIVIGLSIQPQNIYISLMSSIVMVWVSVLIVPSIISGTIGIIITTICLLMLYAGGRNK